MCSSTHTMKSWLQWFTEVKVGYLTPCWKVLGSIRYPVCRRRPEMILCLGMSLVCVLCVWYIVCYSVVDPVSCCSPVQIPVPKTGLTFPGVSQWQPEMQLLSISSHGRWRAQMDNSFNRETSKIRPMSCHKPRMCVYCQSTLSVEWQIATSMNILTFINLGISVLYITVKL